MTEPFSAPLNGLAALLTVVSRMMGISKLELRSRGRRPRAVEARQLFMWGAIVLLGYSTMRTARYVNRDHSTAIHGRDKIERLLLTEQRWRWLTQRLRELCESDLRRVAGEIERDAQVLRKALARERERHEIRQEAKRQEEARRRAAQRDQDFPDPVLYGGCPKEQRQKLAEQNERFLRALRAAARLEEGAA